MIVAVSLLFIGIPFVMHQLTEWNNKVSINYEYESLEKADYINLTNINGFGETGKILLYEYAPMGATEWSIQDNNILWAEDMNASQNAMVVSSERTQDVESTHYSYIRMVTDIHISDLAKYESIRISVNSQVNARPSLYYCTDYEETDFSFSGYKELAKKWDQHTGNKTHWWNFSALDILMDRVEWESSEITGNEDNPLLMFQIRTENGKVWETGDVVKWQIDLISNSLPQVSEISALEIGALIMGIVLIGIAFVSTPWWNPTDPNNPGWFDRLLSRIFIRLSGNRDKRKRR